MKLDLNLSDLIAFKGQCQVNLDTMLLKMVAYIIKFQRIVHQKNLKL